MWFIKWVPYPLTCSDEVTAQNTISVKPWMGNIRKQIPPIGRPSLINAKVRCLLYIKWMALGDYWLRVGKLLWSHQSKTNRVMYSLGILGNWCEKTFCKPTNHDMVCLDTVCVRELPTTWNDIKPRRSSCFAASSLGAFSGNTLWNTKCSLI